MEIARNNLKPIVKKLIDLNNLPHFDKIDLNKVNELLNGVISNYTYNTLDLITLLMNNYDGNFKLAMENIKDYSSVRFNCYHTCKILRSKLDDINIKSYLISYKSIGFSNSYGDNLIKEAHMSLVIPTLRNNKVYYVLLDPGLRIPEAMCFYADDTETEICIDNDVIKIKKTNDLVYSYTMEMTGFNRYSLSNTSYSCQEFFDIKHEVVNPEDVLFPAAFHILLGYRIINFNVDRSKTAMIKLMIVDRTLECVSENNNLKLSFSEINSLSKEELMYELKKYANILNINLVDTVDAIKFLVEINDEFKREVMDDLVFN